MKRLGTRTVRNARNVMVELSRHHGGIMPTLREVAAETGLSLKTVHRMTVLLEECGYLSRPEGDGKRARSLRVVIPWYDL